MDLASSMSLVKAAILYGDRVTVYSPAATLISGVAGFSRISGTAERIAAMLEVIRNVPQFASQVSISDESLATMHQFLSLPPDVVKGLGAMTDSSAEIDEAYSMLQGLKDVWTTELMPAVDEGIDTLGGRELLAAVDAGLVRVAELASTTHTGLLTGAVRAATGATSDDTDDLVAGFMERVLDSLVERGIFPLLDAESSGLVKAFELETGTAAGSDNSWRRSAEITSAATFMDFLPNFIALPLDEVVSLRAEVETPLVRFRSAMAKMSRDYESRSVDGEFSQEVEDAWRETVAPAIAELREAFAEHGLLKQVGAVALGSPKQLALEAGAVFAAAGGQVPVLSRVVATSIASGVAVADVLGRALKDATAGKKNARQDAFYFLHRVGEAAGQT